MSTTDAEKKLDLSTEIQKISSCERRVKITVARSEIDRYFQNEFVELEKTAYVPGFRIGKAPRKLVEKRFKKDIVDRVKSSLVVNALSQVNESDDFTPISEPDFDYDSLILPEEGPFVFEFAIEVRPEFDLPEWKGLKIEKPVRQFTSEDIDKTIAQVLVSYGTLEVKEEPAEPGDYIETKLTFKSGDEILSSADHETIRLRSVLSFHDGVIPDFAKTLTGAKPGDVISTKTQLTEDAQNPKFQGKTIDAIFEIIAVKKLVLPSLSESFFERIGGYKDEAEFRDATLDRLNRQLVYEQQKQARRQITELLTVAATWDLPPTLLKRQSEREFQRKMLELQRSSYSNEDIQRYANFLRQNSASETARALKEHFILEKIAEVENLVETEEDYDLEIEMIAMQSNSTPRRIRAQLEKTGGMDILRNQIIERKVIELIAQHAIFKEIPFDFENSDEEAIDWAAAGDPEAIAEVTQEDLKAVNREFDERKKFDPNTKIK